MMRRLYALLYVLVSGLYLNYIDQYKRMLIFHLNGTYKARRLYPRSTESGQSWYGSDASLKKVE